VDARRSWVLHTKELRCAPNRGTKSAGICTNAVGSRDHNLYLLGVGAFSFPRIEGCRDVIAFMAGGHREIRESCIRIQSGIDLLVGPA
jgi:hypothetical protein